MNTYPSKVPLMCILSTLLGKGQALTPGDYIWIDTCDGPEWRVVRIWEGDLITHCRHAGACSDLLGCELEDDGLMNCLGTAR